MKFLLQDTQNIIDISENVFCCDFNNTLVHQVITSYMLTGRQGSRAQKSRSDVRGSGRKPWRQKGTGRARAGSLKSPIWRSGGVTFALKTKNFFQKVNKKMYRGALRSIFSELVRKNRLIIFKEFSIDKPKTKLLLKKLHYMGLKSVLILLIKLDLNLFLASRNIPRVDVQEINSVSPVSLISFDLVLSTTDVIRKIEGILNNV
ncbi:MAG: 50S ribosomal subunit protein L4 [Candidatus Westeberhardia cardiocondylae]|nr:50S ribosomal subunit protein L4 [Candidatus Westeberhardia cardiocondylae]